MPRPWTARRPAPRRNLTMPGLSATVGEQIAALKRVAGDKVAARIKREPDPFIIGIVAGWPRNFDAEARAQARLHDGRKDLRRHHPDPYRGRARRQVRRPDRLAGAAMTRVASIGECMIELKQARELRRPVFARLWRRHPEYRGLSGPPRRRGRLHHSARRRSPERRRCSPAGRRRASEPRQVARLKGKLPGIYLIETDAKGERRFFHWRESAAARS